MKPKRQINTSHLDFSVQPQNIKGFKNKLYNLLRTPSRLGLKIIKFISPIIKNDSTYVTWEYRFKMGHFPNLKNPRTFNDKMQWMKLNDRNPLYTNLVDKYSVKEYVKELLGTDENIIPTLGVWDSFDEIDFNELPQSFVLKTTHDSGGVVIVKDKTNFDKAAARRTLERSLRHNYYMEHREWPYKDVKRRIIAEKYMVDESGVELKDYKFFCFNGEPRMLFIATDRPYDTRFDFFDIELNHLPFTNGHPQAEKPIYKPDNYEEMVSLARKLSKGLHQVRIDLYNVNGHIYFGEMTFFHFAGACSFTPQIWDEKIGSWWSLP